MSDNLTNAKALLSGHTCVLCLGENIKTFTDRGIAPALFLAECGEELGGAAVADSVVGKATALLYAGIGVTELYAGILSRRALPILEKYGIAYEYGELTEYIVNRQKNGSCPMEAAVKDIDTPQEAIVAVKKRLAELKAESRRQKELIMREYLTDFFDEFDYSTEDATELLNAYDKILLDTEAAEILDGILSDYDTTLKIAASDLMPKCERIAELISAHPYTTKLLAHICLSRRLRSYYAEKGVDDELWFGAMLDLKYKLIECRLIEGIAGTFVADCNWFSRWYDMTRFALGRLQYEILPFRRSYEKDGKSLTPESKVLNIHIPRTGTPLDRESVLASYRMAREFFKDDFTDQPIAFICSSWLLFPEHEKILHEKSNIRKFMSDFDIIDSNYYDTINCGTFWRIFDVPYTDNFDEIPEDTFLKRAYKEHLKNGGKLGYGYGVSL